MPGWLCQQRLVLARFDSAKEISLFRLHSRLRCSSMEPSQRMLQQIKNPKKMRITDITNGVTRLTHNGTDYLTDCDVGEIGESLHFKIKDGDHWVNWRTGKRFSETEIHSEAEPGYAELEAEMYPDDDA